MLTNLLVRLVLGDLLPVAVDESVVALKPWLRLAFCSPQELFASEPVLWVLTHDLNLLRVAPSLWLLKRLEVLWHPSM